MLDGCAGQVSDEVQGHRDQRISAWVICKDVENGAEHCQSQKGFGPGSGERGPALEGQVTEELATFKERSGAGNSSPRG